MWGYNPKKFSGRFARSNICTPTLKIVAPPLGKTKMIAANKWNATFCWCYRITTSQYLYVIPGGSKTAQWNSSDEISAKLWPKPSNLVLFLAATFLSISAENYWNVRFISQTLQVFRSCTLTWGMRRRGQSSRCPSTYHEWKDSRHLHEAKRQG